MLANIAPAQTDDLMLGFETSDDAAIYALDDKTAAVLTVDFFTPIVDDPYDFGRITAANALSDVYAMGGRPLTAMNLLAFPCSLGPDIVGEVVRGGADVCRKAGVIVVGGHTIDDKEPKFGLSVFGTVDRDKVVYNRGCEPGDSLYLTKPIGTGILMTALKRDLETEESVQEVVESMATLNWAAGEAMVESGVHAGTDVTGFGLAGHLHEMVEASGCAARIDWGRIPRFARAEEHAAAGCCPGRTHEIVEWAQPFMDLSAYGSGAKVDSQTAMLILCDPQTSGGMLVAVSPENEERFEGSFCELAGFVPARIGEVVDGPAGTISVQ